MPAKMLFFVFCLFLISTAGHAVEFTSATVNVWPETASGMQVRMILAEDFTPPSRDDGGYKTSARLAPANEAVEAKLDALGSNKKFQCMIKASAYPIGTTPLLTYLVYDLKDCQFVADL